MISIFVILLQSELIQKWDRELEEIQIVLQRPLRSVSNRQRWRFKIFSKPGGIFVSKRSRMVYGRAYGSKLHRASPPRQPRQLPWLIFGTMINYKKWPKQLGRFQEKKYPYFSTKQKNSLNILCLFCRIKEIYIFTSLPSIKYSLNILGLFCRFEEINIFIVLTSKKSLLWTFWELTCT